MVVVVAADAHPAPRSPLPAPRSPLPAPRSSHLLGLELDLQVLPLALQAHAHFVEEVVDLGQGGEQGVLGGQKVLHLGRGERDGGGRRPPRPCSRHSILQPLPTLSVEGVQWRTRVRSALERSRSVLCLSSHATCGDEEGRGLAAIPVDWRYASTFAGAGGGANGRPRPPSRRGAATLRAEGAARGAGERAPAMDRRRRRAIDDACSPASSGAAAGARPPQPPPPLAPPRAQIAAKAGGRARLPPATRARGARPWPGRRRPPRERRRGPRAGSPRTAPRRCPSPLLTWAPATVSRTACSTVSAMAAEEGARRRGSGQAASGGAAALLAASARGGRPAARRAPRRARAQAARRSMRAAGPAPQARTPPKVAPRRAGLRLAADRVPPHTGVAAAASTSSPAAAAPRAGAVAAPRRGRTRSPFGAGEAVGGDRVVA